MKLIYIHRHNFDKRPPVISVIYILLSLGIKPILITTDITDYFREDLTKKGVTIHIVPYSLRSDRIKINLVKKIIANLIFRYSVYKILKNYSVKDYSVWLEGGYTFRALGKKITKYRLILQIQELHQNNIVKRSELPLINKSELIFMPEYNRSVFYQIEFKLKERPLLLPNKPYFLPSDDLLDEIGKKHQAVTNQLKNKKVILYQGIIHPERDLSPFIKAIKELGDEYIVVLVGEDYGALDSYMKVDCRTIHINYLSAPEYLYFTRLAHIGIVAYDPYMFNTAYCAPNKIFEYAAFGVPMIGNDIPGLRYSIDSYKMGIIVDDKKTDEITNAIKEIERNYTLYSNNATLYFDSVDNKETIKLGLKKFGIIA